MAHLVQKRTPIYTALAEYNRQGILPFHVPGHKQGRGFCADKPFLNKEALKMDLTSVPETDNVFNPKGAILEAEQLASELYGADRAFFLVNGTTSGIQAMIASVCSPGDKIIMPRNAHRSAIGGLVLSGAYPIYVLPEINKEFGISMGVSEETLKKALETNPDARAVFLINPNYYGTTSNLKALVDLAHSYDLAVLVDEAHGAHLPFAERLPLSALQAGADLVASSMHKLGGSLTQSSILFLNRGRVSAQKVQSILNLIQTTSPSYLLLASLDLARYQLAEKGKEMVSSAVDLALYARRKIKKIKGLKLLEKEEDRSGFYALDPTKIVVNVAGLGLTGYEAERILRQEYKIQLELSDLYNVLFLISLGDKKYMLDRMVSALKDISDKRKVKNVVRYLPPPPAIPELNVLPRDAFYANACDVSLEEAEGKISAEAVMAYPPGIPLVCPGEVITSEIIEYISFLKQENAQLEGAADTETNYLRVLGDTSNIILWKSAKNIQEVR